MLVSPIGKYPIDIPVHESRVVLSTSIKERAMNVIPIVFMQDEEASEVLDTLGNIDGVCIFGHTEESVAATVEYLSHWDSGDSREFQPIEDTVGTEKRVEHGDYVLTWNYTPSYVALDRKVTE
jgi:hypothetical protein